MERISSGGDIYLIHLQCHSPVGYQFFFLFLFSFYSILNKNEMVPLLVLTSIVFTVKQMIDIDTTKNITSFACSHVSHVNFGLLISFPPVSPFVPL